MKGAGCTARRWGEGSGARGGGEGGVTHLHQRDERGRVESVHLLLATLVGVQDVGEMARWRDGKVAKW